MKTPIFFLFLTASVAFTPLPSQSEWLYFNTDNGAIENDYVNCVTIGVDNNKWFGTYYQSPTFGPLFRVGEDSVWEFYWPANNDIGMNSVITLAADRSGNIWVGTQTGGLVRYNGLSEWVRYDVDDSLQYLRNVSSVAVDTAENVWVGTLGSGVGMLTPDSVWTKFDTTVSPIVSNQILSVYADPYGEIWFGTFKGVSRFNGDTTWITYDTSNSDLADNAVRCFQVDNFGQLWIGTNNGLSVFDRQGAWQKFDTANSGIGDNQILDIVIDSSGYLWLAHPYPFDDPSKIPVSRFDGLDQWDVYDLDHFFNTQFVSVNGMAIDQGGNIWFATDGEGVFCMKSDATAAPEEPVDLIPEAYHLYQNFPNPFNSSTVIELSLPARTSVSLNIYNIKGERVRTLIADILPAGRHQVVWDGADAKGNAVASGLYFYRMSAGEETVTGKMVLLK